MYHWLADLQELRSALHMRLRAMGENFRDLHDERRRIKGLHVFFEDERRGIGKGHGLRTEIVEGTKDVIRELLNTFDLGRAREKFDQLRAMKDELFQIHIPENQRLDRIKEADQELVECCYFIDLFPVVFLDEPLPDKYLDPDDLCTNPAVFMNGLLDVISELTKSVGDYLLEVPDEKYSLDLVFKLKGRCVGVCQGLHRFLDEYEYVYGGVIDMSRFFPEKYKSKVRRQADGIRRMRESLEELRERKLANNPHF